VIVEPQVEIQLTPADRAPLLREAKSGVGLIRYMPLLVATPLTALTVLPSWIFATSVLHFDNAAASAFGGAVAYLVFILIYYRLCRIVVRRNFAPDGSFLERRRFIAAPDGLHAESDSYRTLIFWPSIRKVIDTPTHILLMSDVSQGYVIPKRCFPDERASSAFVDAVRLYTGKPAS
jgi:hypothetical protein